MFLELQMCSWCYAFNMFLELLRRSWCYVFNIFLELLSRSWCYAFTMFLELLSRSWCYAFNMFLELLRRSWCYTCNMFLELLSRSWCFACNMFLELLRRSWCYAFNMFLELQRCSKIETIIPGKKALTALRKTSVNKNSRTSSQDLNENFTQSSKKDLIEGIWQDLCARTSWRLPLQTFIQAPSRSSRKYLLEDSSRMCARSPHKHLYNKGFH